MEIFGSIAPEIWMAGGLALYMAWAIGANDVANAMGTSVGSGALTIRGAIVVAAFLEFGGAFLAGGHVTDTVRKGMLDMDLVTQESLLYGMLASLTAAATLLLGATRFGLTVSTTHSIVGAIVDIRVLVIESVRSSDGSQADLDAIFSELPDFESACVPMRDRADALGVEVDFPCDG